MAEVLLSASTGAMNSLIGKLQTMLSDEYRLLKEVRGDIKFLEDELVAMKAFLMKMADVEAPNEQEKLRVRVVRELSYDMDDKIDKFMVLLEKESNSKAHGLQKLIEKSKKLISDVKIRHEIAKDVKYIKNQVMEVSERHGRYKIDESSSMQKNTRVDRFLVAFKDASELVGIDGPIVRQLKEDKGGSAQNLKVVSIVGSGGLGKTTLAKQVYDNIGETFDCRAIVSISRNPDMTKMFSSILSQIKRMEGFETGAEHAYLVSKIREFLGDKRYFIVVDDVWEVKHWRTLESAFVKNNFGSRILVTTRINDVAKSCCGFHDDLVCQIKPLGFTDSKRLFFKRIFGSAESCPPNLREASEEILKKCGGLPLAITAISSLLATSQTRDLWDRVQRSIGFAFGENSEVDTMREIISMSYFQLRPELRSCLLYLTLFPEDSEVPRTRLVHRWISEGFIHSRDGQDLVELGEIYFHELINRSLIQPLDIGYDGKAWGCQVHDTILDFLIHKSTEENFCTLFRHRSKLTHLQDTKVRRLSLIANEGFVSIPPELNVSHIRSLGIFGYVRQLPSFSNFDALRVLDLEGNQELQNHHLINIARLSQLRYLNINYTPITELPREIGNLRYLGTLDARSVDFDELPETLTQLQRLARLFVDFVNELPDGVGNMKHLQEIDCINICKSEEILY